MSQLKHKNILLIDQYNCYFKIPGHFQFSVHYNKIWLYVQLLDERTCLSGIIFFAMSTNIEAYMYMLYNFTAAVSLNSKILQKIVFKKVW